MNVSRTANSLLICLLFVSILGCNQSSAPHDNHAIKKEITIWLFPGTGFERLIEEYEDKHPEIRINLQTSSYQELSNKLQTTLASGSGAPDIALIEISFLERFKQLSDSFDNLLQYGAEQREQQFLPWKWQQAVSRDRSFLLGLPTDIGPIAMTYRLDLFEKAGLPVNPDEVAVLLSSWDSFLQTAQIVKKKTGKPMIDNLDLLFRVILGQYKEQYYDLASEDVIIESSEGVHQAWNTVMKAKEEGVSAGLSLFTPEWSQGLENGDFAVAFTPSWMIDIIKDSAPNGSGKWGITYIPRISSNYGGSFLALPKGGKHPQEAYQLIDWLTQPEQQLRIFEINGNFPSQPELYNNPVIINHKDEYFNNAPTGQIYSTIARTVQPIYEGPDQFIIAKIMFDVLYRVERDEIPTEKAWDIAIQRVRDELNYIH